MIAKRAVNGNHEGELTIKSGVMVKTGTNLLKIQAFKIKICFDDACRLDASAQNVLLGWNVVRASDSV